MADERKVLPHSCSCHVRGGDCEDLGCGLGKGGVVVDGLYVPPIGLFGFKNIGKKVWGERPREPIEFINDYYNGR